jgi:Dolichyl-phosphate-mannose-protein mannosyltransferase
VVLVSRRELAERAAVGAAFAVALIVRIPSLGLPLIEWHGWRQTWTAYTAVIFHERGIDLLHPQLPIFGPPFEVPMEFPVQQAVAALVMDAGVGPDLAMRLTNLAAFFLTAALLYGLMRRIAGPLAGVAAVVFFLFVPTNVLWSRASLVEYGGTAGAVGFLWAGLVWRDRRRWTVFAIALAAGTLGMLIKPTTPIFWTLPLLLWRVPGEPAGLVGWIRARLDPALIALCVVPTAVALVWTSWADAIKGVQEAAAFLTSTATRSFYYASLAERVDPVIWKRTWLWISTYVIGTGMLPVFAVGVVAAWRSTRPAFWGGVLLAALVPFAVFYGAYYKHDYYWAAVTPQIAAIVGLGVAWLVTNARTTPRRAAVGIALVSAVLLTASSASGYLRLAYPPLNDYESVLPRARELAAQSRADDLVLVVGRGYDADLAYYSRRRMLMLTAENLTDHLVRQAATQPYRVLFSWDPTVDDIWVARYWPWNGVVAAHTYTLGARPADLRAAPILTSDDTALFDATARTAHTLLRQPLRVPCDLAGHQIPAGAAGTWLRIRPDAGARISPTALFAPVAARSVLVLTPLVTFGQPSASLFCSGSPEIVIEAAFDAPPPD